MREKSGKIGKKVNCHLDRVLLLVRLLVQILPQEVPGGPGALGRVELPAPQGQGTEGQTEGQAPHALVDGEIIALQVQVIVKVQDGEIVPAQGVEFHVCEREKMGKIHQ